MAKELVIQISGDIDDYKEALKMAEEETAGLGDALESVAKYSAVAFAAFTAEVFLSTRALEVERRALDDVNTSLQSQGIYSRELADQYRKTAEAIEAKTGIDADAISSGQAVAQSLIGQTKLTDELTQRIVDFSVRNKTDLQTSFTIVAKAIEGNVGALQRYGIHIDASLTKQQRLQQITEKLGIAFGGAAESAVKGTGNIILLERSFDNLQKKIGEKFAPALAAAYDLLTKFFTAVKEDKELINMIAALITAGLAVSSLGIVVGVAGLAFLKFKAALLAAEITMSAVRVAAYGLIGALGIGALVIIATEVYLHWNTIFPRIQAIFHGFVLTVVEGAKAIGAIFDGIISFSPEKIKKGISDYVEAYKNGFKEATKTIKPIEIDTVQDPAKAAAKAKQQAIEDQIERFKLERIKASNQLINLETERASIDIIALKKQEVDLLSKLEDDKNENIKNSLIKQLAENRKIQEETIAEDKERRTVLNDELLASNEEFQALSQEQKERFIRDNQQNVEKDILIQKTAQERAARDRLLLQVKSNNEFLLNQVKFGTAYALINQAMNSAIFQGTKTAFANLAELQTSSNATLKGIGKVAAVANIIIKTAESAMNIYAGFSTIPIIGPALGIAGAAAAIAFGAEQIGKVQGAAEGGLIVGGIPGKDSVPVLAQQGEIVAPAQNFEEVIGSVRAGREAEKFLSGGNDSGGGGQNESMISLLQSIDAKLSNPMQQVYNIAGDVLGDPVWIDRVGKALSDAIEFRNLKIRGVNV